MTAHIVRASKTPAASRRLGPIADRQRPSSRQIGKRIGGKKSSAEATVRNIFLPSNFLPFQDDNGSSGETWL
jgi:hypothetical protein